MLLIRLLLILSLDVILRSCKSIHCHVVLIGLDFALLIGLLNETIGLLFLPCISHTFDERLAHSGFHSLLSERLGFGCSIFADWNVAFSSISVEVSLAVRTLHIGVEG